MEAFENWFRTNGGYLHPAVHLAQDAEQGSYFRATADIEPGTHVLTVPHNLAMSNLNAQVDDDFPVFRTHAQSFTVEGLSFFYLMAQWLNKEESFWKPYLNILPSPEQGFETPIFYDDGDRKWLEGTENEHQCGLRSHDLRQGRLRAGARPRSRDCRQDPRHLPGPWP